MLEDLAEIDVLSDFYLVPATRRSWKVCGLSSYKKLAILANPEVWSQEAKRIVDRMANKTIEFAPSEMLIGEITDSLGGLLQEAA